MTTPTEKQAATIVVTDHEHDLEASLPPSPPNGVDKDKIEYPDGGWTAWSQVLVGHVINAMTWGYAASFGVYQLYYVETLGLPASQVSWIGSVQLLLNFSMCVVSGRLSDAGYARETVMVGCGLAVVGTFMTSLASEYWHILLAQGVCVGLGLGLAFMPAISVCASYFLKNRPFALSVSAVGTSVGSVVFPATVQYLTPVVGFPWAVRCSGFIALAFTIVAVIFMKPRLSGRKSGPVVEWGALRELPYVLFALGAFLNFYALYFVFFYINSFARNVIGFSTLESVNMLLITNGVGIVARPLAGFIANNYLGSINTFIIGTGMASVMLFSWAAVASRAGMYVFAVVYGVGVAANQSTFVASLANLTKDPRKMGTRFGMVEALCGFAALAGTPTAGAILDKMHGQYLVSQMWAGGVTAAAALAFLASRIALTGWTLRAKV